MRCVILTAMATRKNRKDSSDQYLEKNAQLWTRVPARRGNQSQFVRNTDARNRPETMKANRQPFQSANKATIGTETAEVSALMASRAPIAWARLAGEITSDTAAAALGGSIPPARPVNTLRARSASILGAKADPMTDAERTSKPARATGRRPKESDKGPTETTETPQAAKVAVAN